MSCKNYLSAVFHFVTAVQFFYAVYYEVVHILPIELTLRSYSFGGKLVYLTFLNGIINGVYHTIAFANDFVGTNEVDPENPPMIRRVRDFIFSSLAVPLSTTVASFFWGLYAIDRELVFPTLMDTFYPSWLNHVLHSNVFIFIIIEMFLLHHKYANKVCELSCLGLFIVSYYGWIHVIKYVAGAWVYPFLDVLDFNQRFGFFVIAMFVPIAYYFAGELANSLIWPKRRLAHDKKRS